MEEGVLEKMKTQKTNRLQCFEVPCVKTPFVSEQCVLTSNCREVKNQGNAKRIAAKKEKLDYCQAL